MLSLCLAVTFSGTFADAEQAVPQRASASSFSLENGLQVIVVENHRSPLVVNSIWYKVGSSDEGKGRIGISHMLEHMMFKGTKNVGPGEFREKITDVGGSENGETTQDYTMYYEAVDKHWLDLSLDLEVDRMSNLMLDEHEFEIEKKVVLEEVQPVADDPETRMYSSLWEAVYPGSRNQYLPGGTGRDVEDLSIDAVRAWYHRWYRPDNAVMVIVGDVDPVDVQEKIILAFHRVSPFALTRGTDDALFRARSSSNMEARRPIMSPLRNRRIDLSVQNGLPSLFIGCRIPAADPSSIFVKSPVLRVLREVLGGGEDARLQDQLVERERLADTVDVTYNDIARGPQLFLISIKRVSPNAISRLSASVWQKLKLIGKFGVDDAELRIAINRLKADRVYDRDLLLGLAGEYGEEAMVGMPLLDGKSWVDAIGSVTAEQVKDAAVHYLTRANCVEAVTHTERISKEANFSRAPSSGIH